MIYNKYDTYIKVLEYASKGFTLKIGSVTFPRSVTIIRGEKHLDLDYNLPDRVTKALDCNPLDQKYFIEGEISEDRKKYLSVNPILTAEQQSKLVKAEEEAKKSLKNRVYKWGD